MKVSSTFYCQILNPIQAARRHPAGDGGNGLATEHKKSSMPHATDVKKRKKKAKRMKISRQTLIQVYNSYETDEKQRAQHYHIWKTFHRGQIHTSLPC
jgi:hypothetical protein